MKCQEGPDKQKEKEELHQQKGEPREHWAFGPCSVEAELCL